MLNMNIRTTRCDSVADEEFSRSLRERDPDIVQKLTETFCNKCAGFFGKVEEGPIMFSYDPERGKMIWWHTRGCRSFYTRKTMNNRYKIKEDNNHEMV